MVEEKQKSLAEKLNLTPPVAPAAVNDPQEFQDDPDYRAELEAGDYQAFLVDRQPLRRAEMLDLILKNGQRLTFSYSHLYRTEYEPSVGIRLYFSDHLVTIGGVKLLDDYRKLISHRVIAIKQADQPTIDVLGASVPIVTKVVMKRTSSES